MVLIPQRLCMKKLIYFLVFFLIGMTIKAQTVRTLFCQTYGSPTSPSALNEIGFYLDGNPQEYNGCGVSSSIMIAVIDSCSCSVLNNCNVEAGQVNTFLSPDCTLNNAVYYYCRSRPTNYFQFDLTDSSSVDALIQFLNVRTSCEYILAYTWYTYPYSNLDSSFKDAFINLGASAISALPDDVPYIFFCKMGNPGSVIEVVGTSQSDTLSLLTTIGCSTTGIKDVKEMEQVSIFPNPAVSHVSISGISAGVGLRIDVLDLFGTTIHSETIHGADTHTLDVNLSRGVYLVRLAGQEGKQIKKLIIH